MAIDVDRGTGRTTLLIKGAPRSAIFVAKTRSAATLCQSMGVSLGRKDLKFVDVSFVNIGAHKGMSNPIVFDHDCEECNYVA